MILLMGLGLSACSDDDEMMENDPTVDYSGNFTASGDNVNTSATGSATAVFNTETRELSYEVQWQGLTSPVVNMHFHDDGPVIYDIEGWAAATSGSVSGMVTLKSGEAADLAAGKIYVQIHTETYPPGEVIATLTKSGSNGNNNPPGGY